MLYETSNSTIRFRLPAKHSRCIALQSPSHFPHPIYRNSPHKKYWCSMHTLSLEVTAGKLSAQPLLSSQSLKTVNDLHIARFHGWLSVLVGNISAEFDSVVHFLLLQNTFFPWFCNSAFSCFYSYLISYNFSVLFTKTFSSFQPLRCYSVQGSFFRKFIFSIYNHSPRGPHPVFWL